MQRCRRREDILEVLGTGFLEAVERRVGVVLGQALVVQAVTRQRHRLVLGERHANDLSIHLLAVQMAHGFILSAERGKKKNIFKRSLSFYTLLYLQSTAYQNDRVQRYHRPRLPLTQLSLVGVRHLNEGAVFFIVKDFHPLDITVHSCMRAAGGRPGRQAGRQARGERARWETKQTVRKTKTLS